MPKKHLLLLSILALTHSLAAQLNPAVFAPAVTYNSGGFTAFFTAVGDVNGDGTPDLIVANYCGVSDNCGTVHGTVAVLLGNGDGTFQSAVTYDSGGFEAYSLALRDVNGDGKLDILVANECSDVMCATNGNVGVLLGLGNGIFQPVVTYPSGGLYAYSVATGDVNGDGKPDIVVANGFSSGSDSNGSVGVLLGNGNGTFQTALVYPSGGSVADSIQVADLNHDGKLDILVANATRAGNGDGTVGVLLGKGDGSFEHAVTYDAGGAITTSLAVGDVNRDGKVDVIVANSLVNINNGNNGTLAVLLGNGDGTLRTAVAYNSGGQYASSVALADVNGDGKLDLLASNLVSSPSGAAGLGSVSVLLGKGDGTFHSAHSYSSGAYHAVSIAVADLNRDGKPDLVAANYCIDNSCSSEGIVSVLINRTKMISRCELSTTLVYRDKKIENRFTARVLPVEPTPNLPSGKVAFWDSAYSEVLLGTGTLVDEDASITVFLEPEPNPQWVKAMYKGDANFVGCESPYLPIFFPQ